MLGLFSAVLFEARFVRFAVARRPLRGAVRLAVGVALFFGVSTLLKKPFSPEFLARDCFGAHLVRALRYALASFAVMGLYPLLFRPADRLWKGKG